MIITLNEDLVRVDPTRTNADSELNFIVKQIQDQLCTTKRQYGVPHVPDVIPISAPFPEPTASFNMGFIPTLFFAYCNHRKILINPQDLWFIVMTELAREINANTDRYRHLFTTKTEGKTAIIVNTDDITTVNPNLLFDQVKIHSPLDVSLLVPPLTTETPTSRLAFVAAVLDAVQAYYDYMTMLCGIPAIKIGGTKSDWVLLSAHAIILANKLDHSLLWRAAKIFNQIALSFESDQTEFWKDIFTTRNVGSGSQQEINGWITQLTLHNQSMRLESLSSTYAMFPYTNLESKRNFKAVYGAFRYYEDAAGFLTSEFDTIVYEVLKS